MTREELCQVLGLPADTSAAALVRARTERIAEIRRALNEGMLPKPVRLKFQQELSRLESAGELVAKLDFSKRVDGYLAEITAEFAKPSPVRGVIRLCLDKLKPLVAQIDDEAARFEIEKRVIEAEERFGPELKPPPPEPVAAPSAKSPSAPAMPSAPTVPPEPAAVSLPRVPSAPGAKAAVSAPARGTLLQLLPLHREGAPRPSETPIHIVARPRFILGRRRAAVDFVTAFLSTNEENRQKNETISRINATLFIRDDQIWVQDGGVLADGKFRPSENGTVVDGHQITAARAFNFYQGRRLTVGLTYELIVLQLPAVSSGGPGFAPIAGTLSPQPIPVVPMGLAGCLRFQPVSCRDVVVQAVWLFSEAALGADAQCAVRLEQAGLPPVAARIHYWQDGFWLEVPAGGGSIMMLDQRGLAAGEVMALQSTHSLRLGDLNYELRIS
jgi:hypothetical protein